MLKPECGLRHFSWSSGADRRLDDLVADRLGAGARALGDGEPVSGAVGLGHGGGFRHLEPVRGLLQLREVLRRLVDLLVGHRLGEADHGVGVGLARIGAEALAVLELEDLLLEVLDRQADDIGVLGAADAVRQVAERAGVDHPLHVAVQRDLGHVRRMVGREPVGRAVGGDLGARHDQRRARDGVFLGGIGGCPAGRPRIRCAEPAPGPERLVGRRHLRSGLREGNRAYANCQYRNADCQ